MRLKLQNEEMKSWKIGEINIPKIKHF